MRRRGSLKRRGAVLIVVLGILVVLALLATTLASLQQIERTIAKNYIDDIRAKLLAQSGVEYAISQIREMMAQGLFSASAVSQAKDGFWACSIGALARAGFAPVSAVSLPQ